MKIIYAKDYDSMSRKAANILSAQVILKPDSVLGLATGSTPVGIYQQLVKWYCQGDVDFSACHAANLDEYAGLSTDSDQSYAYFMRANLFDSVNIKPENCHIPCGTNRDIEGECRRYNEVIRALGGVDMQLLGIGHNGHIGFNEPGTEFGKETHHVRLTDRTIEANARYFAKPSEVPTHAFTMGIKSIMGARRVLLVASGRGKAEILHRMIFGAISTTVPASILQLHNDMTVVADEEALSLVLSQDPTVVANLPDRAH